MSPSLDTREHRESAWELKFLVTRELADQIRQWACFRLLPDPNGGGVSGDSYRITSLYLDTEQFDVCRRRGSFGRSKYRVRRYGDNGALFLERKLRTSGFLAKRRTLIPVSELETLGQEEFDPFWPGYWWYRRVTARKLRPVCRISYSRTARVAMTSHGPIRLTLDCDLRAAPCNEYEFGDHSRVLSHDKIILELKFRYETPVLFKYLVEEFALEPSRFSKYRFAAEALGLIAPQNAMTEPTMAFQHA